MVNLEDKLKVPVSELSYGDQRLLDIVLSVSLKPKILMLDEPFSGLGDMEIAVILDLIKCYKE
jgi:branched-chain amino acid transport system ATP-binding protein